MTTKAEQLRQAAAQLRREAQAERQVKTAQVICAASSLHLLTRRLGVK